MIKVRIMLSCLFRDFWILLQDEAFSPRHKEYQAQFVLQIRVEFLSWVLLAGGGDDQ